MHMVKSLFTHISSRLDIFSASLSSFKFPTLFFVPLNRISERQKKKGLRVCLPYFLSFFPAHWKNTIGGEERLIRKMSRCIII